MIYLCVVPIKDTKTDLVFMSTDDLVIARLFVNFTNRNFKKHYNESMGMYIKVIL